MNHKYHLKKQNLIQIIIICVEVVKTLKNFNLISINTNNKINNIKVLYLSYYEAY